MTVQRAGRMSSDTLYIVQVVKAEQEQNYFGLAVEGYYLEVLCCAYFTRAWIFAECDPAKVKLSKGYWEDNTMAALPTWPIDNPL